MRTISAIILLVTIATSQPVLAFDGRQGLFFSAGHFTWEEFVAVREVRESGLLLSLGYGGARQWGERYQFRPVVELFGGSMDYDGRTLTGVPADTTVNYYGLNLHGDAGPGFLPRPNLLLRPFAGLGLRAWLRDLQDGTSATGAPVSGYTEGWLSLDARLGLRTAVRLSSLSEGHVEAGVKLPWFTRTIVNLSEAEGGTVRMEPGMRASLFAEIGLHRGRLKASLFYDSLRFPASDVVSGIFQPRSTMDVYGLKLGWKF
jgi:hypothetical protein